SRKKRMMMASPGPTNSQAAQISEGSARRRPSAAKGLPSRQHLAAFLEDAVHPAVEVGEGGVDGHPAADGGLQALPDLDADLLPFRDLGGRHHPLELGAEGGARRVVRKLG